MAKQYWIGEYYVDLSRNQISQLGQSQTLPPKALMVLTYLAENQGKVVSYDELLDKVWANSVVTPNTLQRSIAQLRKALGENSKSQEIIKTHAKQGYSLECDISWSKETVPQAIANSDESNSDETVSKESQDISENQQKPLQQENQKGTRFAPIWLALTAAVVVLVLILPQLQNNSQLELGDLRYVTATDDKEYGALYSPDDKFILFQRYYEKVCINDLWAKNTSTLEEVKLTSERGTYEDQKLSPDGKKLIFIKKQDCTQPISQNICYKLMSLDFEDALKQPQIPQELLDCQNSAIALPTWIDNDNIVMMQRAERYWQLINYSVSTQTSSKIYQVENGNIMTFAHSLESDRLALVKIDNNGEQFIDVLSTQGELLSSHKIQLPDGIPYQLKVFLAFRPHTGQLILISGGQLYTLSSDGIAQAVSLPLDRDVGSPAVNSDGSRIMLITGRYDSDVSKISLISTGAEKYSSTVFQRSIEQEKHAKFQPTGSAIALVSAQTGTEQIWVTTPDGNSIKSAFPKGTFIADLHWSSDGESLLTVANWELHQIGMNGTQDKIEFPYPITSLYHWDSNNDRAMARILMDGSSRFVVINLSNLTHENINDRRIQTAVMNQDGKLIFMDHLDRIWKQDTVEDKLIEALQGQGSDKGFVISGDILYGINKDNQLWSFNLATDELNLLSQVSPDIRYLTDANENEVLATVLISEKKEVIELSAYQ